MKANKTRRRTQLTTDASAVSERLARARLESGLTQAQLAERVGVIERTVQNYEAGRIPWQKLDAIAEVTGKSKQWLLHGEVEQPRPSISELELVERLARIETLLAEMLRRLPGPDGDPV